MFKGKIKILESDATIQKNILESLKSGIKIIMNRGKPKIESAVKAIVIKALSASPEIRSLQSGKLRLDFGLDTDPTTEIIYAIANSTYVSFKDFQLKMTGTSVGFNIYVQPTDFQNLFSLPASIVTTKKGASLPWLQWLLTAGDAVIVTSYHVQYGPSPNSRSGGAIMVPKGLFKVDSAYSGIEENNFITRALERYQDEIAQAVEKNL
jgi:hypothetical protein